MRTKQEIMTDSLETISDAIDKRQGSLVYDALVPFSSEAAQLYMHMDTVQRMGFLDTATGDYLERLASQFGTNRIMATQSIGEAIFDVEIPPGTRFSVIDSDINFVVGKFLRTENWGDGDGLDGRVYEVKCEQFGQQGNLTGALIPIDFTIALRVAFLLNITYLAIDDESDDALRKRTLDFIRRPHLDGNVAQYLYWANQFPGVGEAFIERDPGNINTVNVYISDENGAQATPSLVESFQKFLDPGANGHGLGQAPIGAVVNVRTLTEVKINITVIVLMDDPTKVHVVQDQTEKAIRDYVTFQANTERAVKSYEIAKIVDDNELVSSVDSTLLNGAVFNVKPILPKESVTLVDYIVQVKGGNK